MREVTKYQADDGTVWDSSIQAAARDDELRTALELEAGIGPRVPNLRGWVQRDPAKVAVLRRALVQIGKKLHPAGWWDTHTPEDLVCPTSLPSRIMSESSGPISSLWWRVSCIDSDGREWEQAYWLQNIEKGLQQFPREYREGD